MWSLERNVPLKACPNAFCRREKTCHRTGAGGQCAITHYCNKDEWYDELTAKIHELQKEGDPDPETRDLCGEAKAASVYKALRQRAIDEGLLP